MRNVTRDLIPSLIERRVPQILAIYAGASFAVLEFTDFMVEEFLLSPHWTRIVLVGSILLLPSVYMLGWYHGKSGRDRVARAEKIGIPANVAFAVAVLWTVFAGADLGAATTAVTVETEDGEVIERVVAKAEFRKRTALFPLDAGPGIGEDETWLAYAVPLALEFDLAPDDFFQPIPVSLIAFHLGELGFDAPRDLPVPLMREVAEENYAQFLVAGAIDRSGDGYRVTLALHEAANGSLVEEAAFEGSDLLALVDEMSVTLKAALDIPARDEIDDLPVRERLTSEEAAWREYVGGMIRLSVQEDLDAAIEHMNVATALDPTFTAAHRVLAVLLLADNRQAEALAAIQLAMDHLYRLPERAGFGVKSDYYFIAGEIEKAWAVVKMWVDLYPEDVDGLRAQLITQQMRGEWEGVLSTLNTIHRLTPRDAGVLKQIAAVHEQLGDEDAALEALNEYVQRLPNDHTGYMDLAAIQRRRGAHDLARENIERAILIEPLNPDLTAELASLDLAVGRFDEARAGYERGMELARTALQRSGILRKFADYHAFRGEIGAAIRTLEDWLEEASGVLAPIAITQLRFSDIDVFLAAGRRDEAVALFEELQTQVVPPISEFFLPHYAIHLALAQEDLEAAREAHARSLEAVEAHQFGVLVSSLTGDLGRIQEGEGDHEAAAASYRSAMDLNPTLDLHWRLSRVLRMLGQLEEARSELEQALRARPSNPRAHLQMAYVREASGDVAGAVEHLRSALVAWENADEAFEPAREAREKLAELGG